ncbi:MAG: DMT family transporter [Hyphomicrobiales bacterium]|nr:DMT family transporter [Hyphomicrobiales bacterium]
MNSNSPAYSTQKSTTGPLPPLSAPLAFAALTMGAIAMGVSPVFVRFSEVGPFASAFWRVFLALPVLFLWAWLELRRKNARLRLAFPSAVLWSGLFFAGDLIFWHLAIVNTTMANATFMACLAPVWVIMFSGAFIGESVGRNSYFGLALCLVGAAMLIGSSYNVDPSRIKGDLFGLVTSLFFGLYFLSVRVARRSKESGELTLLLTIITAACLLLVAAGAVIILNQQFFPSSVKGITSLLMLGTISHAGGQGLLSIALGSLSAVFSSLVIFIEAIAGAFFGWLVFDEKLTSTQFTGAIAILLGIWIARPRQT